MDIFAQAQWQQQLFVQRVAADLEMLTRVQGVQARCIECVDFGVPVTVKAESGWLAALVRFLG